MLTIIIDHDYALLIHTIHKIHTPCVTDIVTDYCEWQLNEESRTEGETNGNLVIWTGLEICVWMGFHVRLIETNNPIHRMDVHFPFIRTCLFK